MPEIRVQDESGNIHVFPDGATPEMITKVMRAQAPGQSPIMHEISNAPGGVTQWLKDLEGDLRYGSGNTFIGRTLKAMGAQGVNVGAQAGAGDTVASLPLGVVRAATGVAESTPGLIAAAGNPQAAASDLNVVQGVKDVAKGTAQAATIPSSFVAPEIGEGVTDAAESAASALRSVADSSTIAAGKVLAKKAAVGYVKKLVPVDEIREGLSELERQRILRQQYQLDFTQPVPPAEIPPQAVAAPPRVPLWQQAGVEAGHPAPNVRVTTVPEPRPRTNFENYHELARARQAARAQNPIEVAHYPEPRNPAPSTSEVEGEGYPSGIQPRPTDRAEILDDKAVREQMEHDLGIQLYRAKHEMGAENAPAPKWQQAAQAKADAIRAKAEADAQQVLADAERNATTAKKFTKTAPSKTKVAAVKQSSGLDLNDPDTLLNLPNRSLSDLK